MTDPDPEAVARAICRKLNIWPDGAGWVERNLPQGKAWQLYQPHAQAALDALRPRLEVADKAISFVGDETATSVTYMGLLAAVRALDQPATPGAAETEGREK